MNNIDYALLVGEKLRELINQNYRSQEDFAFDFGADLRTISRYINSGINKISVIQELAEFFNVDIMHFFSHKDTKTRNV